ncbi:hypothetical protein MUK42_08090 [Musa troglodytarum]|uniref:Uncharacterized protein n=1 Tax=Musa troglodytarum TaxID=320322 RepID=A0A9E7HYP8_9LILI|nr:hypothetical protein MUK42_08090 [Musa troglodytarum]
MSAGDALFLPPPPPPAVSGPPPPPLISYKSTGLIFQTARAKISNEGDHVKTNQKQRQEGWIRLLRGQKDAAKAKERLALGMMEQLG